MCQVVMEGNAAQEEQLVIHHHEGGCKDIQAPPLCTSSSDHNSLPFSSSHDQQTPSNFDPPTLQPSIPFNLMIPSISCSSPHLKSSHDDCTIPGSPDFFLPANACIALDGPSSLPTSYSSPSSDTHSFWPHSIPPHAPAFLDCPSLFSSAASSHHETASFFCDQISTSLPYAVGAADSANDSATSYNPSLTRPFHSNVYGHQSGTININGSHHMIQGSEHPYFSGSSPFGNVYSGSDYSLHHNNAARPAPAIEFSLANRALYPHNVEVHASNMLLQQSIVANNEQEQSWHNFLQHDQEDPMAHRDQSEAMKGPRSAGSNAVMQAADYHRHHDRLVHSLHTSHPCSVPMINLNHHSVGSANSRNSTQQQMQLTGLQERADIIDTTFTCSIKPTNKRRTPDGEGQDSWPSAAANAGSPPLKMMRSPGLSLSPTTGQVDLHIHNASPTFINSYNMNGKFGGGTAASCNSATLSPSARKPVLTDPSASPTNQPHDSISPKRPTKASTRQSICNDPQSVAARHRRERISERLKTLQQLVPNGSKVDLVTMLEKAISYVKSLQLQVKVLSTDEYWPTPLSEKYSLNNLAVVATIAASTYS